jgi:hypothetical protein
MKLNKPITLSVKLFLLVLVIVTGSVTTASGITLDNNINLVWRSCYGDIQGSGSSNIKDFRLKSDQSGNPENFQLFKQSKYQDSWISDLKSVNGITVSDQGSVLWLEKLDQ